MANNGKTKRIRYMYTLMNQREHGEDAVVSDYVTTVSMLEAYDIAANACHELNEEYDTNYFVLSVTPN